MTLTQRLSTGIDWPNWMSNRNLFDWPETIFDGSSETAIRVEEFEDKDGKELVVRAECPGVNPEDDIEITVTEGMLRIMVQRKKETTHESRRHYRSEFQYGSFVRSVALPAGCTDQDVKASYIDGVLEVRIPMNGVQAKSKKVMITRH